MGLERDVMAAAAARGLRLQLGATHRWLTVRGHLEPIVEREAPGDVLDALDDVHAALGGDRRALARRRSGTLRTDLVVRSTGQLVEVDELQHFTSARMTTLVAYPARRRFGFSVEGTAIRVNLSADTWPRNAALAKANPKAQAAFENLLKTLKAIHDELKPKAPKPKPRPAVLRPIKILPRPRIFE